VPVRKDGDFADRGGSWFEVPRPSSRARQDVTVARAASENEEPDRRRHDFFDWRRQLRRHALAIGVVGLLIGTAVTVGLARRRRRRQRPLAKLARLVQAVAGILAEPDPVARPKPNVMNKALSSAASAATGMLVKIAIRDLTEPAAAPVIEA